MQFFQISNIFFGKTQVLEIINDLIKTCRNGVTSVTGILTIESIEYDCGLVLGFEIALHHSQLIKVCQHCQVQRTHSNFLPFGKISFVLVLI